MKNTSIRYTHHQIFIIRAVQQGDQLLARSAVVRHTVYQPANLRKLLVHRSNEIVEEKEVHEYGFPAQVGAEELLQTTEHIGAAAGRTTQQPHRPTVLRHVVDAGGVLPDAVEVQSPVDRYLVRDEHGRIDPKTAVIVLQSLGADAVGINCSAGPDTIRDFIEEMREYATVPLIVKPNAGLPTCDSDGNTIYDMDADTFASYMVELVEAGASILGGCCGTTPEYISRTK